jgi:hypothetical protein
MRSRKVALLGGDADDDAVAEDARAAGDGAAVAAALADDRGRLAGDGGLVDAGDAFDHFAVAGDDVARLADDEVAALRRSVAGTASSRAVAAEQAAGHGLLARLAQTVGLGLAAPFGHRLRRSWRTAR